MRPSRSAISFSSSMRRRGSASRLHQLDAEADAGQGRAQLMGGIGQQHLVRRDELLDAGGGAVEALRQPRHLILALDLDARRQLAGPEQFDASLQPLQSAREPARERIGANAPPPAQSRQGSQACPQRGGDAGLEAWPRANAHRAAGLPTPDRRDHRPSLRLRAASAEYGTMPPAAARGRRSLSNSPRSMPSRVCSRSIACCCAAKSASGAPDARTRVPQPSRRPDRRAYRWAQSATAHPRRERRPPGWR